MIPVIVDTAVVVPVNVLPLTDDGDFKTRETAVNYNAAGMDLVWNFVTPAGAVTQTAVTPTTAGVYDWAHAGDGMYTIEIPASGGGTINNDTEGVGYFSGVATGVLPWRGPNILFGAANAVNSLFGLDRFETDMREIGGVAQSATDAKDFFDTGYDPSTHKVAGVALVDTTTNSTNAPGAGDFTVTMKASITTAATAATPTVTAGTVTDKTGYGLADGAITTAKIADEAITAAKLAENAITANAMGPGCIGASQVASGTIDGDTFVSGALTVGVRNAVGMTASDLDDQLAAIKTDTGNLVTRITSTLFSGITSLAQWLGLLAGKQTGNSTARTELRATGAGSGTFDETTHSQEATRDRGDAAWVTATGFSTHSAADAATAVRSELAVELAHIDADISSRGTADPGDEMDLVDAPNATAVTAIQSGLSTYAGGPVDSVTGAVGSVTGDVGGKLLGGGSGTITGTGARVVDASGGNVATAAAQTTAQNDLNILTGTDGATLATAQPNYAPAVAANIPTAAENRVEMDSNSTKLALITEARMGALTDWINDGRLDAILDTIAANVLLILGDTGTDGVAISAAMANRIADHVRRRTQANVEASTDGDTLSLKSEYGFIQQAQESNTVDNAGKLTVYRTDGTTEVGQITLATDAEAEPVVGVS